MVKDECWLVSGWDVVVREDRKDDVRGAVGVDGGSVTVAIGRALRGLRHVCRCLISGNQSIALLRQTYRWRI